MKYYYRSNIAGLHEIFQTEYITLDSSGVISLSMAYCGGDYIVEIDSSLVLAKFANNLPSGVIEYSIPIFLSYGKVRFIFANEDIKKAFESSAMLLLKTKCATKYRKFMVVTEEGTRGVVKETPHAVAAELPIACIVRKRFDTIKGGVVAYVCSSSTSTSTEGVALKTAVRNLKNDLAGLHTRVMMDSHCTLDEDSFIMRIEQAKTAYVGLDYRETNLFEILRQLFRNVVEIVSEKNISDANPAARLTASIDDYRTIEYKIKDLEDRHSIGLRRTELREIMDLEVENGRRKGKTREYFKKGTPERIRKDALKLEIERFESSEEYYDLRRELNRLAGYVKPEGHESVIRALFERMSDVTTSILDVVDSSSAFGSADMSQVGYVGGKLVLDNCGYDGVEMVFFNIVLANVVNNPLDVASERAIMELISESAKQFKQSEVGQSAKGIAILDCLREFWKYKQHKTFSFNIPDDLPVFGSTMSFFVKPFGGEQLDRYMLNRGFSQKKFGFMLWGCCVGYAGLPKTFTNDLYENQQLTEQTDEYLEELLPQVVVDVENAMKVDF